MEISIDSTLDKMNDDIEKAVEKVPIINSNHDTTDNAAKDFHNNAKKIRQYIDRRNTIDSIIAIIIVFISIPIVFGFTGFAIAGAVVLAKTDEIINGPWHLWIIMLVQVIVMFLQIFNVSIYINTNKNDTEDKNNNHGSNLVSIGYILTTP